MNSSKRPGLIARENRGDPQTTRQWLALLADRNSGERLWQPIYGDVPELWREKAKAVEQLLLTHQREFGADRPVWLLRVPARINLMGVHIEHRGGWVNYLPIHRDTWFAVSPRDDHRLLFQNVDSRYQPFAVELADHPWPGVRRTGWTFWKRWRWSAATGATTFKEWPSTFRTCSGNPCAAPARPCGATFRLQRG